jgi:hypothetical protein
MIGYHLYANTGAGDPIDYSTPIATVWGTSYTTARIPGPANWSFDVRAFDTVSGLEEANIDSITVAIDATGHDVTNTPNAPVGISAQPTSGGGIQVDWSYAALDPDSAPTGFHVYLGYGSTPDYSSPVATVSASPGLIGRYATVLSGLLNGVVYSVGVRAFNTAAEDANTYAVSVMAVSVGPNAVIGLTATAIT